MRVCKMSMVYLKKEYIARIYKLGKEPSSFTEEAVEEKLKRDESSVKKEISK